MFSAALMTGSVPSLARATSPVAAGPLKACTPPSSLTALVLLSAFKSSCEYNKQIGQKGNSLEVRN